MTTPTNNNNNNNADAANGRKGINGDETSKPSVFVLDAYHPDAVATLQAATDIDLVLPGDPRRANFHQEATVLLLRSETHITAADVAKCQKLQCIIKQGVGTDNIDARAAAAAGIRVYNTPGLNAEAVAELSLTMALSLARRVPEMDRRIRAGEAVVRSKMLAKSLHGKTLGLVGMGNVSLSFARKWVGAMEGSVVGYDPFADEKAWAAAGIPGDRWRRAGSLDEVLDVADVVSLHVPLTSGTRNMISAGQFARMKDGAILVNAARGGIVDEAALSEALRGGRLFGAGLDAMETEPPTLDSCRHVFEFPNVLVTPHVGASTFECQSRSGVTVAELALNLARGVETGNRVA